MHQRVLDQIINCCRERNKVLGELQRVLSLLESNFDKNSICIKIYKRLQELQVISNNNSYWQYVLPDSIEMIELYNKHLCQDKEERILLDIINNWQIEWGWLSAICTYIANQLPETQNPSSPHTRLKYNKHLLRLNREILFLQIVTGQYYNTLYPLDITIDPTNICNYRCRTCFQHSSQDFPHSSLNIEDVSRFCDGFPYASAIIIGGTGEPVLSKCFSYLISMTNRTVGVVEIITNASVKALQDCSLGKNHHICISIDGAIKETFETIRVGVPFEKIIDAVRSLRKKHKKQTISFNVTVSRLNVDELVGIGELAIKLEIDEITINMLHPYMLHLNEIVLQNEDMHLFEEQLKNLKALTKKYGIKIVNAVQIQGHGSSYSEIKRTATIQKRELIDKFKKIKVSWKGNNYSLPNIFENLETYIFPSIIPDIFLDSDTLIKEAQNLVDSSFFQLDSNYYRTNDVKMLRNIRNRLRNKFRNMSTEELCIPWCFSPWVKVYIEATKQIRPCCVWEGYFDRIYDYNSILEIRNSYNYTALRKNTLNTEQQPQICQKCDYQERHARSRNFFLYLIKKGVDLRGINIDKKNPLYKHMVSAWNLVSILPSMKIKDSKENLLHETPSTIIRLIYFKAHLLLYYISRVFRKIFGNRG